MTDPARPPGGEPTAWASVVCAGSSRSHGVAAQLLHQEVSRLCDVPPGSVRLTRMCRACGSAEHGRPVLLPWSRATPPSVSVSRSAGLTAVAVSSAGAVGIDVEDVAPFADQRLSGVMLHARERGDGPVDRATTWVRKEALLKAAGCGLEVDPRRVRLGAPGDAPVVLGWPSDPAAPQPTWMVDLDLGPDVRAAMAGFGSAPETVRVRWAAPGAPRGAARRRRAR